MAALVRRGRLGKYPRFSHPSRAFLGWYMFLCSKLLLFSLVLVLATQLPYRILSGKSHHSQSHVVSANDECQDTDIIKPPRFGKREAYLDNYDKCDEKRKVNSYSNHRRLMLKLLSALSKDRFKDRFQSRIPLLSKNPHRTSDNLGNVFNRGNVAIETLQSSTEPVGTEVITKAIVSKEKQSATKQINDQGLNLLKRMNSAGDRSKSGGGWADANAKGYFGIFHELQEYSQGHSFPDLHSYLQYLANKSQ